MASISTRLGRTSCAGGGIVPHSLVARLHRGWRQLERRRGRAPIVELERCRLACGSQIGARTLRKALIVSTAVVAISMTIVLQRVERYYCSPSEDPEPTSVLVDRL